MNLQFKTIKLGEIADFERAKKGEIYKKESIAIQVSATQGETIYLEEEGEIETKYVIIKPKRQENMKYLYFIVEMGVKTFLQEYISGMNIQMEDLKLFEIKYHTSKETQKSVVEMLEEIEKQKKIVEREIAQAKEFKKLMLKEMFV